MTARTLAVRLPLGRKIVARHAKTSANNLPRLNGGHFQRLAEGFAQGALQTLVAHSLMVAARRFAKAEAAPRLAGDHGIGFGRTDINAQEVFHGC